MWILRPLSSYRVYSVLPAAWDSMAHSSVSFCFSNFVVFIVPRVNSVGYVLRGNKAQENFGFLVKYAEFYDWIDTMVDW